MKAIFERRSCRNFNLEKVELEKIDRILRAGMQAPSGRNEQAWEVYVVRNSKIKDKLASIHPYTRNIKQADVALVVAANQKSWRINDRYFQQDLAAMVQNMLLEACHLGLGSLWHGIAPNPERMSFVQECLDLSADVQPFAIIAIGYSDNPQINHFVDRYREDRVYFLD